LVFFHKFTDAINFVAVETAAALKPYRCEPELGLLVLTFDMNMRWFVAVVRIKEEWNSPPNARLQARRGA
jgi:hypothetical protein